ncbi:DUF1707 domain-containing protein [Streptomyces sp. NPDC000410]|uniref:DUF1707 SHOCT-like domain-containing protein n=1 Tax=Streptomyces sp. NPDC000410 TaxID=3154254 RepID=UPI00331CA173
MDPPVCDPTGTEATTMHPDPVRASDAEREATVERLRTATAEGRLTLEELAERCEVAYLARTRSELATVAEDLPPAAASPAPASPTRTAHALIGDLTLNLSTSQVPASGELTVNAWAVLGDVTLLVPEGVEVEVRCSGVLGDVRDLTRPRSTSPATAARVRVNGAAILGDIVIAHPTTRRRSAWRSRLDREWAVLDPGEG